MADINAQLLRALDYVREQIEQGQIRAGAERDNLLDEFLLYDLRLRTNVEDAQRFGPNESTRTQGNIIIKELLRFCREQLEPPVKFYDLIRADNLQRPQPAPVVQSPAPVMVSGQATQAAEAHPIAAVFKPGPETSQLHDDITRFLRTATVWVTVGNYQRIIEWLRQHGLEVSVENVEKYANKGSKDSILGVILESLWPEKALLVRFLGSLLKRAERVARSRYASQQADQSDQILLEKDVKRLRELVRRIILADDAIMGAILRQVCADLQHTLTLKAKESAALIEEAGLFYDGAGYSAGLVHEHIEPVGKLVGLWEDDEPTEPRGRFVFGRPAMGKSALRMWLEQTLRKRTKPWLVVSRDVNLLSQQYERAPAPVPALFHDAIVTELFRALLVEKREDRMYSHDPYRRLRQSDEGFLRFRLIYETIRAPAELDAARFPYNRTEYATFKAKHAPGLADPEAVLAQLTTLATQSGFQGIYVLFDQQISAEEQLPANDLSARLAASLDQPLWDALHRHVRCSIFLTLDPADTVEPPLTSSLSRASFSFLKPWLDDELRAFAGARVRYCAQRAVEAAYLELEDLFDPTGAQDIPRLLERANGVPGRWAALLARVFEHYCQKRTDVYTRVGKDCVDTALEQ